MYGVVVLVVVVLYSVIVLHRMEWSRRNIEVRAVKGNRQGPAHMPAREEENKKRGKKNVYLGILKLFSCVTAFGISV